MLKKLKELWIRFIMFNRTIPFWHNWTGPSNKGGDPVSWLDQIAKAHDKESKTRWLLGAFTSTENAYLNMKADFGFIGKYLAGVLTWFQMPYEINSDLNDKKWKAVGNTIVDAIIGVIGCVLFIINIFPNSLNCGIRLVVNMIPFVNRIKAFIAKRKNA